MKSPSKTVFEIILVVTVVFAIAIAPKAAEAQPMKKHGPVPFAEFDKDGNGFVSEEEFNSTRAGHMAEMAAAGMPMKGAANAPAFADLDTDGDAQLNEDELVAGQKAHMKANRAAGMGKGMGKGKGKGKGKGRHQHMGHDTGMAAPEADAKAENMTTFEDIDTDGDGMISREEFAAHHASHHGKKH